MNDSDISANTCAQVCTCRSVNCTAVEPGSAGHVCKQILESPSAVMATKSACFRFANLPVAARVVAGRPHLKGSLIPEEIEDFYGFRLRFVGFMAREVVQLVEEGCRDHRVLLSAWILVVRPRNSQ